MKYKRRRRADRAGGISWGVPAAVAALTVLGVAAAVIAANLMAAKDGAWPSVELGAVGHDVAAPSAGPDIHFAATGVDFGKVPLGKEVGYEFSFTNAGSEVLRIEDVQVRVMEGC